MEDIQEVYHLIIQARDEGYLTEKETKEYVHKLIESYVNFTLDDLKLNS